MNYMAKRFSDTDKWKKPFIRSLQAPYKLFWLYILDDCDHAGIWQVDIEIANIKLGEKLCIETALKQFGSKITVFDNGEKWFIKDFIDFQYGELNPKNRVHESVLNILNKYKLLDEIKPLTSPLQGAMDKDKDKYKDKIKEIDEFLEFRKSELNQYSDEIKAKLKKYKITEPICFIGKGIPVQYYDLVEILVNVIFDLEWQKDLVNRFGLLRFENSLIDFYLTLKASSEYQNYKGENDFKRHYTNWLNKNVEKYRK